MIRRTLTALALAGLIGLAGCSSPATPTAADTTTDTTVAVPATTQPKPTTTMVARVSCPLGKARCPDPKVTPGHVMAGARTAADVCAPGSPGRDPDRQIDDSDKRMVLAAYHLPPGAHVAEWDHLISYWAGGDSTARNVWPTLNTADKARKDRFEYQLYRAVCQDDTMTLERARVELRQFWRFW